MKRQTILKSTLFLLMAMVCHVAWAQTTYVVSANTGSFNAGWASEWTYNTTTSNPAQLKLITTNGAGNMQGSGGEMYLYTGSAAEKTCTYRLSVELPYKIVGYSFNYQDKGSNRGKTITINGTQYTVDETVRDLGMSGINTRSTEFTLSGENERVTFTNFKVKIQAVPTVTLYYTYTYNGTSRSVACLAEVGESYPVPTLPYGLSTTTAAPSGTVQNSDNGRTFAFACTGTIPFEYASSYSGITKWYYIRMHSNDKKYIEYISNGNYLEWADAALPTSGSTDAYAWAFVGNPFDGFKLYNRQVGSSKAVASTGSGEASMTASGTTFTLWGSKETSDTDYFCLKTPSGNFLNAQNGRVKHWGDNDAGSTLLLSSAPLNVGSKFTLGSVTYDVTNSTNRQVEIDDVSDAATSIDIPASVTYDGVTYNVTSIGNYAFDGCSSPTSITLPAGVTSIGEGAFQYCSSLTNITIPEGVTSIGQSAFKDCSNLKTVINLSEVNAPAGSSECGYLGYYATTLFNASTGELYLNENYNYNSWESYPWHSVRDQIKSVEFGSNVISIGQSAFYGCSSLTSISLHDGVTSIGEWAFYNCPSLTSITLPEGVTSIGKWAFYNCSSLTNITIPKSVTSIGDHALGRCKMLTNVTIPEGVTSIEDYTFEECSSLTNINIPEGVTSIGQGTFYGCSSLTSITLPEGVTSIRELAFYECSSLTNITILESVTSIGEWAFCYCSSLTNITIPEGVTSVGQGAFEDCPNLKTVINLSEVNASAGSSECGYLGYYATTLFNASTGELYLNENYNYNSWESYPWHSVRDQIKSVEFGSNVTSIGDWAFYNCSSLPSITLPESVTVIGLYAFSGCSSLTNITIPEGVTSIGQSAFNDCSSLTSITLPEGVTSIGIYTFSNCSNLTSITLPESVTSIGGCAFYGCSSLTSITLPEGVTSIGDYAFDGCSSLTSITLPDGVTSIRECAFRYCSSLTSITLPDGVTSIENYAFSGCSSLTSITLPEGVTSIGSDAFSYCSSLTSITLPEGVTSIENWAFEGCSSLTSISIPDGVTSIGIYAFYNCSSLTSISIPDGVTSIGDYAFDGCSSLTFISIPDGVTSIRECAFRNCSSLTSITIPESVTSIGKWAFWICSSLTNITIPANVESIGADAFYGCSRLGTVTNLSDLDIVARSETHGYVAYYTDYVWDKGVNDWSFDPTTGNLYVNYNFDGADADDYPWHSVRSEVKSVNIGSKVTKIGTEMFADCVNLTSIAIPNGVVSIGNLAFNNCGSLTSITIPASVTDIHFNALIRCSDLSSIVVNSRNTRYRDVEDRALVAGDTLVVGCASGYIPEDVKVIGRAAFRGRVLDNSTLKIPEGVTSIEQYAFVQCKVNSIHLPQTLKKCAYYSICAPFSSVPVYITEIHIDDLAAWFDIDFDYNRANPLETGADFYVDGTPMNETLAIPAGVTELKKAALAGWKGREIIIPEGVTSIGELAIYKCKNLTTVTIPSSVTRIDVAAFCECQNLQSVYCYAESVPTTDIDAFEDSNIENATLYVPAQAVANYQSTAPWSGFGNIVGMGTPVTGVTLNKTAATLIIGETLELNATITPADATNKTVKWSSSNTSVATVDANGVVTAIADGTATITATAGNCSATCTVTVKGWSFDEATGKLYVNKNYYYSLESYPWHTVREQITSVELGPNVTSIGNDAFQNCSALTSVSIPNSVTSIGEYAFYYCSSLANINIPEGVTSIGDYAFLYCSSLVSIAIPNSVTSIGKVVFYECSSLVSINIPEGVTSIGEYTFYNCSSLESITIPEGVTSIGEYAFYCCSSLTSINIPSGVTSIGDGVFLGCSSLTSINIPEGVTSIGGVAFSGCSSLTSINIPEGVTSIGNDAFYNCSSLESITIPEGVTSIGNYAFSGCSSLTSINIPSGVTCIGDGVFSGCSSLTTITIPANVTEIKEHAFYGCNNLNTVINLSNLDVEAGSETHGYVAYYADKVWTRGVHLNETAIVVRKGEEYILEATVITEDTNDKTVTWQTNNHAVAPVANGVVTASEVGTTIIGAWAAGDYAACDVTVYTPGDVNLDGMVLVDDIVLTINEVLTIDMENFLFEAADMDRDNQIMVNDVTMVINTALGIDTYAAQRARSMARTTMTASQEGAQYSVSLSNATDYVAMQFDMMLPEGMNLDAIKMAEGNSHAVRYNLMENGAVRVVVASLGNEAFVSNQVLSICVSGNDSEAIVLTNVCLSTRDGELVQLDDAEIEIQRVSTHIQPEAQATATADIYDLNGRLVKKNATSTEGLDKGVYLMNGKKITVK